MPGIIGEGYVTAFSSPHRADIGDFATEIAATLLQEFVPDDADTVPRDQVVAIAQRAADLALPRLLEFVGSGELDYVTGAAEEVIRFCVDPHHSKVSDDGSNWAWVKTARKDK